MTAAVLDRSTAAAPHNCRFASWCAGNCDYSACTGEFNYWSDSEDIEAYNLDERFGVQLFGYEVPDGVDPVRVYLALGDDAGMDVDGFSMTPAEARDLGAALFSFTPKDADWDDELVFVHDDNGVRVLSVEFRHIRQSRRGIDVPPLLEFSMKSDNEKRPVARMSLDGSSARWLGRKLIEAADQADDSNRAEGLTA